MMGSPATARASRLTARLLLLGLILLLLAAPAAARRRKGAPARRPGLAPALHAYDRDIGRMDRPSRALRRRFPWGRIQDVRVDPLRVGGQLQRLAAQHSDKLALSVIGRSCDGRLPLYRVDVKRDAAARAADRRRRPLRVLITAGVHGDEPTGVYTALSFLRRVTRDEGLRRRFEITVLPMLNPTGLQRLTRCNADGRDVNRSYAPGKWTPEARAMARTTRGESYDLYIDLHGANKPGHFLFRAAPDGKLSGRILSAMHSQGLLDVQRWAQPGERYAGSYWLHTLGGVQSSQAQGIPPPGRVEHAPISADTERYMYDRGTPFSFTLEYPRRLPPRRQVQGMMKLLRSTLHNVDRHGGLRR